MSGRTGTIATRPARLSLSWEDVRKFEDPARRNRPGVGYIGILPRLRLAFCRIWSWHSAEQISAGSTRWVVVQKLVCCGVTGDEGVVVDVDAADVGW